MSQGLRWVVLSKNGGVLHVFGSRMSKKECLKWVVLEDGETIKRLYVTEMDNATQEECDEMNGVSQ